MSRPTKQGVDYFPLDVQFDDKIELLIAEKGGIAVSVLITAWQLIYQNDGYFINYSKDVSLLIKRRIMINTEVIEDVILAAVERGVFDKNQFKKNKILTSKAIQKRYFVASKKKKTVRITDKYLCTGVSVGGNATCSGVSSNGNATKVKVEVEVEVEEEEVKTKPNKNFTPPTVEQVAEYVLTREVKIDSQSFVDHYTTNGWFRGKTKIKNWEACVRTWERKQKQQQGYRDNGFDLAGAV